MRPLRRYSAIEQVANHLRNELVRGTWRTVLPGVHAMAAELGVNPKTVAAAFRLLEKEHLLASQGVGRPRRIQPRPGQKRAIPLRVAILDYEPLALTESYAVELLHLLIEAGHNASFATKCLLDLRMDVRRIARLVEQTGADAWVVAAAPREVLEWFVGKKIPAFALFGERRGLPIAGIGPDKTPVVRLVTRRLVELGHRRIVLLERRVRPSDTQERAFLEELESHAIATGPYNLPVWKDSADGFHACLNSLFRVTAPTALLVEEPPFVFAAMQFLMSRKLRVPEDVSLVCLDCHPHFVWCRPSVAQIRWDIQPVLRRVLRWCAHVSEGREDVLQTLTQAQFVPGGTLGPAPGGSTKG